MVRSACHGIRAREGEGPCEMRKWTMDDDCVALAWRWWMKWYGMMHLTCGVGKKVSIVSLQRTQMYSTSFVEFPHGLELSHHPLQSWSWYASLTILLDTERALFNNSRDRANRFQRHFIHHIHYKTNSKSSFPFMHFMHPRHCSFFTVPLDKGEGYKVSILWPPHYSFRAHQASAQHLYSPPESRPWPPFPKMASSTRSLRARHQGLHKPSKTCPRASLHRSQHRGL